MVHNFDACSKLWRDDPVRAALEKKQRAEASAQQRAESSAKMAALLQRKLNEKAGTDLGMGGPSGSEVDDEANYRRVRAFPSRGARRRTISLWRAFQVLELQRKRLLDGHSSDSDSSESSVFDPFANKCARSPFAGPKHRGRARRCARL